MNKVNKQDKIQDRPNVVKKVDIKKKDKNLVIFFFFLNIVDVNKD